MNPIQNVVANGRAFVTFQLGDTINKFYLKFADAGNLFNKSTMLTRIVGYLNGTPFYDVSGAQQVDINDYLLISDDATILTIDFTDLQARTLGGHYQGAIGTAKGVSSLRFDFDLLGAPADLTIEGFVEVTEPQELDRILSRMGQQYNFPAAGKNPFMYPFQPGARHLIKRDYFFGGVLASLEVKKNGIPIHEDIPVSVVENSQSNNWRAPQAGMFVHDPVLNNDLSRVINLSTAQTLIYAPNITVPGAVQVVSEKLVYIQDI
jgi:hypothetical protein